MTPALFHQETVAARRMIERVEKLGVRPESLGADKAYGSGEFLAWLLARDIQPHIPVIDRRHQTGGHFTRNQFRYAPAENTYYCPEGKPLHYSRLNRRGQGYIYSSTIAGEQCLKACPNREGRPSALIPPKYSKRRDGSTPQVRVKRLPLAPPPKAIAPLRRHPRAGIYPRPYRQTVGRCIAFEVFGARAKNGLIRLRVSHPNKPKSTSGE